jgi:hypothetical protein
MLTKRDGEIENLLQKIKELWFNCPTLTFGQLIILMQESENISLAEITDATMLEIVRSWLDHTNKKDKSGGLH